MTPKQAAAIARRIWLRVLVCKLRGHNLEPSHHTQATLFCRRCRRIQFYYHPAGLIVPWAADAKYLEKLGIGYPRKDKP